MPIQQSPRYIFANMERTSCFILDQSALSYQTTEYDVFEVFSENFLAGLAAVHEAAELNYIDRIGARYLDVAFPKDGESLEVYLQKSVLGLAMLFDDAKLQHAFTETHVKRENLNILARAIIQEGQVGLPADLHPSFLNLAKRFQSLEGLHAILDTDSFVINREAFSLDSVRTHLTEIHSEIEKAFRATVTPEALEIWS